MIILNLIFAVLYILLAAWFIKRAVQYFKEGAYFLFGVNVMLAIVEITLLAKLLITN